MRGKDIQERPPTRTERITPAYAGKSERSAGPSLWTQDHPRVCGEKDLDLSADTVRLGSPPRMRGKVSFGLWNLNAHGITPAYAGKSQFCGLDKNRFWDHPRVCGEKPREARNICLDRGSPPRMRGKDSVVDGLQCVHGITPAYAGKSWSAVWNLWVCWDHPRVCGEKSPYDFRPVHGRGSPPHMRGKVSQHPCSGL